MFIPPACISLLQGNRRERRLSGCKRPRSASSRSALSFGVRPDGVCSTPWPFVALLGGGVIGAVLYFIRYLKRRSPLLSLISLLLSVFWGRLQKPPKTGRRPRTDAWSGGGCFLFNLDSPSGTLTSFSSSFLAESNLSIKLFFCLLGGALGRNFRRGPAQLMFL
jgi:hypothetical protein